MEQINERGCLINQRRGCDSGSPCSSRKSKDGMQEDSDIFIPTPCLQQEYVVNLSPGKHRAEGSVPQTMKSTASISGGRLSPSETNGLSAAKGEADAALSFAAGAVSVRIDQEANTRVRRKIDCNLLPWMCGLYLLQYLDKTTLSYASSMGIIKDTGMTAGQYSWTGSIFYIGYLVFEYPPQQDDAALSGGQVRGCVGGGLGRDSCCDGGNKGLRRNNDGAIFPGSSGRRCHCRSVNVGE